LSVSTYTVSGMTCQHCVAAVTQEVSKLPGVENVAIELVPEGDSTLRITSSAPVAEDVVRDAVDEAGYALR
jgi:copper chaperone